MLFFHTVSIELYGGAEGVRDRASLEAALVRPWSGVGSEESFPTPCEKAAALCESIIRRHPFVDGNKRTAVAAAAYLLERLGREISAPGQELEKLAVAVARGEMGVAEISTWMKLHSIGESPPG